MVPPGCNVPPMTTDVPRRRLASVTDAAKLAACSGKTIRRLIASGELTGYRLGARMIRVDLDELNRIMRPIIPASDDAA